MQMQADLANQVVVRPKMIETTAAGAAFLAGLGVKLFGSTGDIARAWREDRRFVPTKDRGRVKDLVAKWHAAVKRA
jgi:glycerol kinase